MGARKFLIVTTARSGSNQLVDYINQIPGAVCFGELFKWSANKAWEWKKIVTYFQDPQEAQRLLNTDLQQYWSTIAAGASAGKDWVGAKLFYEHRKNDPFWSVLRDPELTVIHLYRPRMMDTFLSLLRAEASGVWVIRENAGEPPPAPDIVFDEKRYLEYRDFSRETFTRIRSTMSDHPRFHEICYDDISNVELMSATLERIYGAKISLQETLIKQSRSTKLGAIRNEGAMAQYADDLLI